VCAYSLETDVGVIFRECIDEQPVGFDVAITAACSSQDASDHFAADLSLDQAVFRRIAVAGILSRPGIRFPASTPWKVLESRSPRERREPPNQ